MTSGLKALLSGSKLLLTRHGGFLPLGRRLIHIVRHEGIAGLVKRGPVFRPEKRPGITTALATIATAGQKDKVVTVRENETPDRFPLVPGVLLVGHPHLVSGRGEDLRTAAHACARAQIPFKIRNTFDGGDVTAGLLRDFSYRDKITTHAQYRANLFFLNADEMEPAHRHLGTDFFQGRYNIGYWAWELSRFPEQWLGALDFVDEIWAPSRFIQQAVAEKAHCPVIRMPLAVEFPTPPDLTRVYFGLPDGSFLFLFFFDFTSFVARKNPEAVLQAFFRAFGDDRKAPVHLVIKLNGMSLRPDDYRSFMSLPELEDPRVSVIDRMLTDQEIRALVKMCDCFVSLHRSEGFGRGPAEAMYLGKPVIVTGYSGTLDFSNELNACLVDYELVPVKDGEYPFGAGQVWADPDAAHAAWHMRRLVEDPAKASEIAERGAQFIRTYHSLDAIGARYRSRLEKVGLLSAYNA